MIQTRGCETTPKKKIDISKWKGKDNMDCQDMALDYIRENRVKFKEELPKNSEIFLAGDSYSLIDGLGPFVSEFVKSSDEGNEREKLLREMLFEIGMMIALADLTDMGKIGYIDNNGEIKNKGNWEAVDNTISFLLAVEKAFNER
jgi:hypothetical protein